MFQIIDKIVPPSTLLAVLSLSSVYSTCEACATARPATREFESWADVDVTKGKNPLELYNFVKNTTHSSTKVKLKLLTDARTSL